MAMKTKRRSVTTQSGAEPEAIVNDAPKLLETFSPGDVSYQGDLVIVCLDKLPASAKPRYERQLADGSTQGSRHVLERGEVFICDSAEVIKAIERVTKVTIGPAYVGPVFVSPKNPTANDLSHPEHGNQGFPADAVCAVVFQRSLDADQREARVRD